MSAKPGWGYGPDEKWGYQHEDETVARRMTYFGRFWSWFSKDEWDRLCWQMLKYVEEDVYNRSPVYRIYRSTKGVFHFITRDGRAFVIKIAVADEENGGSEVVVVRDYSIIVEFGPQGMEVYSKYPEFDLVCAGVE